MAGVIRSWYPKVKLDFVKDGFYPKATDDECHGYVASSVDVAELVVAKVNMDPQPDPVGEEIGGASSGQVIDQDPPSPSLALINWAMIFSMILQSSPRMKAPTGRRVQGVLVAFSFFVIP